MKKLMLIAILAAFAGCHTAHIEVDGDGKWRADLYDNFIGRKIERCSADVKEGGQFTFNLNGYSSDASEQLPASLKEFWAGVGILGRLAAATFNPAVASVPLTADAANADDVAKITKELAAAKAELAKIKAAAKAEACADKTDCADCEVK